jgi:argininosuccinate lyase
MKGLPLTYQRDMQEDKVPLFHAVDTVRACLSVFTVLLESVRFQGDRMRREAEQGFLNATDLADHLARKGMPFRQAHAVAGRAVRHCLDQGKRLEDLTQKEWKTLAPEVGPDVKRILGIEGVVEARDIPGGTARRQVRKQLRQARGEVEKRRSQLAKDKERGSVLELP